MTNICIKNEKIEVNKDDIWQGDLFGRKTVAEDFSKIITSICQPFVLSINAPYGSGKSFFLERWEEQLKQSGEKTVFFNAWNCDFTDKPLLPFLYEFLEQLKKIGLVEYDFSKDAEDCKNGLVKTGNEAVKKLTGGIFDPLKRLEECSGGFLKIAGASLSEYSVLKNNIQLFKDELKNVITTKLEDNKNIYVFVDEIERCRPSFAVELLEGIKHLFNIKGLVFVLGIDRAQLKHTIGTIYGQGMDGDGYLRRFIDLELELCAPELSKYTEYLCEKFDIKNTNPNISGTWACGYREFKRYFDLFSKSYNFSLREVEQIYSKFNIITKIIPEGNLLVPPVLAFLFIIKLRDSDFYNKINDNYNNLDEIIEYIDNIKKLSHSNDKLYNNFLSIFICISGINIEQHLQNLKLRLTFSPPKEPINKTNEKIEICQNAIKQKNANYNYDFFDESIINDLKRTIEYIYCAP